MKNDWISLAKGILQGNRLSLAKAITLCESSLLKDQQSATLLQRHLSQQNKKRSFKIGLSGPPGVGKSTWIESFGLFLVQQNLKLAVVAVDPSSSKSGGSILGDKTRMIELSKHPNAFIRPSPSAGTLGGVAKNTLEVLDLCEASGFDVVLVETVGVGQSEKLVNDMVDMFIVDSF
jgi:LAO/AO transport system kinase